MVSDRMRITGKVTASVYCLDDIAFGELKDLRRSLEGQDHRHIKEALQAFRERKNREGRIVPKMRMPSALGRLFNIQARPMTSVMKNLVVDQGDALIADQLAETPARTKVNNANGYISVGTGFTSAAKTSTALVTPTGSPEPMDATYPQTKGAWGAADDNVTVYRVTFEAGDLSQSGIDEAVMINGATATAADTLAYAQVSPSVTVASSDTLEITWELTFTGS